MRGANDVGGRGRVIQASDDDDDDDDDDEDDNDSTDEEDEEEDEEVTKGALEGLVCISFKY